MCDSEDITSSYHPKMNKPPRVSFSGDPLTAHNGGNDNVNKDFNIEDDLSTEETTVERHGKMERDIVEMENLEMTEIPRGSLNKRRVSVTAAGDAIVVRGAEKSYKSGQPVLNGLNMTVPCGSIYGLLGCSGCGKTTMLSCIVGQRKLDRGNIWIFGEKPGTKSIGVPGRNIGYMPQDISLYIEFSIGETLNYFGKLCGLNNEQISGAKKFLLKLLDLPEGRRRIATLSGGQKRRVSLAAALIHDPELLVLDEPTVGMDPLLRHNIWRHLQKLVHSKRTTVIITTHYIEECRQADNIGIMRSGRLLAERQPNELFAEFRSTNLENIVLNLARKDGTVLAKVVENSKRKRWRIGATNDDGEDHARKEPCSKSNNELDVKMASVMHVPETAIMDSLVRIRAMAVKNFVILLRNPLQVTFFTPILMTCYTLLFFVLFASAVLVVLICVSLGPDPIRMRIGLVNHEVDYLTVCSNITRAPNECDVENLSCHYLRNIPRETLFLELFDNEVDAISAVQKGYVWGYLTFPENFSINLYDRIASGSNIDELTMNVSQIIVRLDETNKQISSTIKKTLHDAYEDFTKTFLFDCGFDSRQGDSALMYREPVFGKNDTDFREFLAPGVTLSLLFFYPIITSSIRFINEKKNGVMDRSLVSGVQAWEIMVAYSISEFFVLLFQSILNYAVLTVLFQINVLGSDFLLIIIFLLSGYGGVSMGLLLGSFCTEEIQAAILAMAAFFPNFILSGLLWPLEGMPVWLQYISQVLPCTLSGESVRSLTSRGWEFTHPNVWPGFVILVAYIIGYFVLTVLFQKIFKR